MEDKFYNDEFEQFLQQQTNNHRMYPTDGVWLSISRKLHGYKKWPALTIAAFTILVATVATSVYFSPKPNIFELEQSSINPENRSTVVPGANPLLNPVINPQNTRGQNFVSQNNSTLRALPVTQNSTVENSEQNLDKLGKIKDNLLDDRSKKALSVVYVRDPLPKVQPLNINYEPIGTLQTNTTELNVDDLVDKSFGETDFNLKVEVKEDLRKIASNSIEKTEPATDVDDKNIGDQFLQQHTDNLELFTQNRKLSRAKKFSYTVYIAPSVSYRNLRENKDLNRNSNNINGPVAENYVTNVNKLVRHKPGTGIEAGVAFTYHNSNSFAIRAGLQFNVRQYNIEAYRAPTELATIALLSNSGVDTVNSYAVYRNANGNYSTELINRYFQVSIPVGVEWKVIGNKNISFNVAATVQPTYNLNDNLYILSTNFKNYMVNSGMLRNWNINSSFEAFMNIKVGDYRWQLGPQFRYQHLPTLITEYPIREHLVDYGFKLGVSKQIK